MSDNLPKSYYRCSDCENYVPGGRAGMICKVTGSDVDNECGFPTLWRNKDCPYNKNCHEYCNYRKYCRYAKGETGFKPDECAMYYKIEDILNETDDIRREQAQETEDDEYD